MQDPYKRTNTNSRNAVHAHSAILALRADQLIVWSIGIALVLSVIGASARALFTSEAHAATETWQYAFSVPGTLREAASPEKSTSPYWWLASGGYLVLEGGEGRTVRGALPAKDPMAVLYKSAYPIETDRGTHPQNLFRMLTRATWSAPSVEVTARVTAVNLTDTRNRHAYNGVHVVAGYTDDANYYYASIRQDGTAAIKRKHDGKHYQLASGRFVPGTYSASAAPNLIPLNTPIMMRMEMTPAQSGALKISFKVRATAQEAWREVATVTDTGALSGGAPFMGPGRIGFASDYMDVSYDNVKVQGAAAAAVPQAPASETPAPAPVEETPVSDPHASSSTTTAPSPGPADDAEVPASGTYGLGINGTWEETGSMSESKSGDWWLNSGAYFATQNGIGRTIMGALPSTDRWYKLYASANPTDTDNGAHPQNIFRLITKSAWANPVQQAYFKIRASNQSASPNREGHNGFLFFSRYQDGQNLYYTGLRVDGTAIIKKKKSGAYTTLAQKVVFPGTYNRSTNPNLLPKDQWIGLKSIVKDQSDGTTKIEVYVDKAGNGTWTKVAEAIDSSNQVKGKAHGGIRTDFMDIEFKEFRASEV